MRTSYKVSSKGVRDGALAALIQTEYGVGQDRLWKYDKEDDWWSWNEEDVYGKAMA